MKRGLMRNLAILAVGIACTCGVSAQNDRWQSNVEAQLDLVSAAARSEGLVRTNTYLDSIRQGDQQYMDFTLTGGRSYAFIGVCDQDCNDVDLYLRDDNGNLVDSDTASDATPIVHVTPRYTGAFRLYIKMVNCSRGPCRWGVGIYQ